MGKSEGRSSAHSEASQDDVDSKLPSKSRKKRYSFTYQGKKVSVAEKEIVSHLFPVFYTEEPFTPEESDVAQGSWQLIMEDRAPQYLAIVSNPEKAAEFPHASCKEWFSHEFYERLFDVHPYARPMFKDPKSQGNFLVALFSFIFTAFDNPPVYRAKLNYLGEVHSLRGVKATEYGIVGEVMFWTLGKILGPAYTPEVHDAWVKIFSSMMKIIVPIAVAHEIKDNSAQLARLEKSQDMGHEIGLFSNSQHQVSCYCNRTLN